MNILLKRMDMKLANKYMKTCSKSLVTREIKSTRISLHTIWLQQKILASKSGVDCINISILVVILTIVLQYVTNGKTC